MVAYGTYRVTPFRTEIDPAKQTAYFTSLSAAVPALSTVTVPVLYTVPAGKVLILGYVKGSADKDCIFHSDMLKNGASYCALYHPQMVVIALSDISGFYFVAGETIGFEVTNPLSEVLNVQCDIGGFLYDAPV